MATNQPPMFIGPHGYLIAADKLIHDGLELFSLSELLPGVTRLFLTDYAANTPMRRAANATRQALSKNGIWAFTNVYWEQGMFHFKKDTFGLGSKLYEKIEERLELKKPSEPDGTVEIRPRMFGYFSPKDFVNSEATEFIGEVSKELAQLADRNRLGIEISGLKLERGGLVRTVCSIGFTKKSIHIHLADSESSQHCAIGKRPPKGYDPNKRF